MTVSEARGALFGWFEKQDSFCLERDYSKLLLITDTSDEEKKAGILGALEDFIETGFVKKAEYEGVAYYILSKPFSAFDQHITINAQTAQMVSRSINNFCQVMGDKRDWCDVNNVSERDVINLTNIIHIISEREIS